MRHVSLVTAEPCVWMAAGVVSYKLCDRDFDCHHCPLDAALRGGASTSADSTWLSADGRRHHGFPEDRRYAAGHVWLSALADTGESPVRIGLDGFAAALLPRPIAVNSAGSPRAIARGDVICDIELPEGTLPIRAPVGGHLERDNAALRDQPGLIVDSPYQDGWLAELIPAWDEAARGSCLDAARARDRSHVHLRHFRRRVALRLLADVASVGPTMQDGGQALTSLSEILGGPQYLRILREVLR